MTTSAVITTFSETDAERADAMRQPRVELEALVEALNPDQRKLLYRRILQALRDPLGTT